MAADRKRCDGAKRRRQRPLLSGEQPGKSAPDDADDRADGQVDAAGDDDEGHADADDAKERGAADEVFEIVAAEKAVARQRSDDADDGEQRGDAEDFLHLKKWK
jgi:hypothetical protein